MQRAHLVWDYHTNRIGGLFISGMVSFDSVPPADSLMVLAVQAVQAVQALQQRMPERHEQHLPLSESACDASSAFHWKSAGDTEGNRTA